METVGLDSAAAAAPRFRAGNPKEAKSTREKALQLMPEPFSEDYFPSTEYANSTLPGIPPNWL
jgi:hypothetical protein